MKFDPEHSRAVQRSYPSMLSGCEPVLDSLSDARRYRGWLAELALPHLGDDPIEVGSGNGDYALEWAPHVRRLTVTEADPARLAALRDRFAGHPTIAVRELSLPCEVLAVARTQLNASWEFMLHG
jgi:ubiquinone/menaquinone biosynthesis C-methylase UbiE